MFLPLSWLHVDLALWVSTRLVSQIYVIYYLFGREEAVKSMGPFTPVRNTETLNPFPIFKEVLNSSYQISKEGCPFTCYGGGGEELGYCRHNAI